MAIKKQIIETLRQKPSSYLQAKEQSQVIDQILGFQYAEIETELQLHEKNNLPKNKTTWSHVHIQGHQTPYSELLEICQHLQLSEQEKIIDFGAGYGRLGIILYLFYPNIQFQGFEISNLRVQEGQRIFAGLGIKKSNLICQDISEKDFQIPDFDFGYIYDFGSESDMKSLLKKLQNLSLKKHFTIVARGKGIRHWIMNENPWLSDVNEPYHTEHWSVFRS